MSESSSFVGQISYGMWGQNLARELNKLKVLNTVCDVSEQALKKCKELYPNVNTTTDYKDLLMNPDIKAIVIASPAEMHYKFAKESLLLNKDVYVEKPITLNTTEAEELTKLAKDRSLILMVGHLLHYHPAIIKIKEMIKSKELGNIRNIISNRLNLGTFRTQENVLWSFAPHDISVILSLCGNKLPSYVTCQGQDNITKDVHDITNLVMKYEDDKIYANINVNWLSPYKEQKMSIICEKGMLLFDDTEKTDKLKVYRNYLSWTNTLPTQPIANKSNGEIIPLDLSKSPLELECQHFIECCKTRQTPITNGEEGTRVITVLNAGSNSLHNNSKRIELTNSTKLDYYVDKTSIVDNGAKIGKNTKIWHWTHVTNTADIGENTSIGQNCYIAGKLGKNNRVQNGVSVYLGVETEDNVFLGPNCSLTNDINPRAEFSKHGQYVKTIIKKGASVGANATIKCGVTLGEYCFIGCGAVVTKDVPAYAIVVGNPAVAIGKMKENGDREIYSNYYKNSGA